MKNNNIYIHLNHRPNNLPNKSTADTLLSNRLRFCTTRKQRRLAHKQCGWYNSITYYSQLSKLISQHTEYTLVLVFSDKLPMYCGKSGHHSTEYQLDRHSITWLFQSQYNTL